MVKKLGLFLLVIGFLVGGPYLSAEESTQQDLATVTATEAPAQDLPPAVACLEEYLEDPMKANMVGCSASYNCVHGGFVSCSAPFGTCSSLGSKCGGVSCDGQTTWCAGGCTFDHHCYNFCGDFGTCDSFGCCECP